MLIFLACIFGVICLGVAFWLFKDAGKQENPSQEKPPLIKLEQSPQDIAKIQAMQMRRLDGTKMFLGMLLIISALIAFKIYNPFTQIFKTRTCPYRADLRELSEQELHAISGNVLSAGLEGDTERMERLAHEHGYRNGQELQAAVAMAIEKYGQTSSL